MFEQIMVKNSSTSDPHVRYNVSNLIRKQCYHYRIQSENGSHKYEFAGTEWLNPQGDSVTHLSARGA